MLSTIFNNQLDGPALLDCSAGGLASLFSLASGIPSAMDGILGRCSSISPSGNAEGLLEDDIVWNWNLVQYSTLPILGLGIIIGGPIEFAVVLSG